MKKEIETAYAPENDLTFIMQYIYHDDELVKMDCIGFYYGEPNDETTREIIGDN